MLDVVGIRACRRTCVGLLWVALLCWAGVIVYLSSLTPAELPRAAFDLWDKINHFVAFAVGGVLAALALRFSLPRLTVAQVQICAVLLIAAFGVVDEALQTLTPGRTGADLADWTADALGATAGSLVARQRSTGT